MSALIAGQVYGPDRFGYWYRVEVPNGTLQASSTPAFLSWFYPPYGLHGTEAAFLRERGLLV